LTKFFISIAFIINIQVWLTIHNVAQRTNLSFIVCWKQFLKTTVVPTIFVTDSEIQPEGRCISEGLEKIVGKRQPVVEKICFQKLFMAKKYDSNH